MISHGGLSEIESLEVKSFGMTESEFYSLPREFRKALIFYSWQVKEDNIDLKSLKKFFQSISTKTNVKEKVLSLVKKR